MAHSASRLLSVSVRAPASGFLTREILAPGAFVLAILASNYALIGLPNVKLFDLLVFVAAYSLGLRRGAFVAAGAWAIYASFNPWGPTHFLLMGAQMLGSGAYLGAGVVVRRLLPPSRVPLGPSKATLLLVVSALLATAFFDLVTNLYTGYHWALVTGGGEYAHWLWVALINPGALFFMAIHMSSNAVLFPVFGPLLIQGAERAKVHLGW